MNTWTPQICRRLLRIPSFTDLLTNCVQLSACLDSNLPCLSTTARTSFSPPPWRSGGREAGMICSWKDSLRNVLQYVHITIGSLWEGCVPFVLVIPRECRQNIQDGLPTVNRKWEFCGFVSSWAIFLFRLVENWNKSDKDFLFFSNWNAPLWLNY